MVENNKKAYSIFKGVLGLLTKFYYRPTIINKEVIPKDGPIIVCGNHTHLFDQNLPIISTKRMLHYMAKIEYFRDKKVAWFFKASGCIPVDRENHGGNSKAIATEVLNSGYALGIYPEGTRNSLVSKKDLFNKVYNNYLKDIISKDDFTKFAKENIIPVSGVNLLIELIENDKITIDEFQKYIFDIYNSLELLLKSKIIDKETYRKSLLLPIKFGTVKLAQSTGATIVPYAITGKYIFRSKDLCIRFGKPFKVSKDDNLEEVNEKLFNSILDLKIKGLKESK